jgi:hypothetical protein
LVLGDDVRLKVYELNPRVKHDADATVHAQVAAEDVVILQD